MKIKKQKKDKGHITMCPYCRQLFDTSIGDKFESGEIKKRWGEVTEHHNNYGQEIILYPEAEKYRKRGLKLKKFVEKKSKQ